MFPRPRPSLKREPDAAFLFRVAEKFRQAAAACDEHDIKQALYRIAAKAERMALNETSVSAAPLRQWHA